MTFEEYWKLSWNGNDIPESMNLAIREVAMRSWNAAIIQEREECAVVCETPINVEGTNFVAPRFAKAIRKRI
jgi:hypothetical protein